MSECRAERVREVFATALELPQSELGDFLASVNDEDKGLYREVVHLLENDASAEDLQSSITSCIEPLPAIEGYKVIRVIGAGGMGTVYEAKQVGTDQPAAIKVLRRAAPGPREHQRFRREAKILGALDHPGIARVFGAGYASDERPFYAMELICSARSLTCFANEEALDLNSRVRLVLQACDAVADAHEAGVIHRDLKPDNILVGPGGRPRVIDFGIARAESLIDVTTLRTGVRTLMGTLPYMSPEQASGATAELDARSDVYSLGVVLYEMLSGKLPYDLEQKSLIDAVRIIREVPGLPLGKRQPAAKGDLSIITAKAMQKDAKQRYASAGEMRDDLQRYIDRRPIEARAPTLLYRTRKLVSRYRLGFAAALLGLTLGTLVLLWVDHTQREAKMHSWKARLLSDEKSLAEVAAFAAELEGWPHDEANTIRLRSWVERAEALERRAKLHFNRAARLGSSSSLTLHEWQHVSAIKEYEKRMGDFSEGLGRRLRVKLEAAERIRVMWDRACRSIADIEECPAYGGLRLIPVPDLVPLYRNDTSGLWEFLYLLEDAEPTWAAGGEFMDDPLDCGIVFVLLPGGRFTMGPPGQDCWRKGLTRDVTLDPFFMSKYEMHQSAWKRLGGENRSRFRGARIPVDTVRWHECYRVTQTTGLTIPTEAQWEYACRAGTSTRYAFGDRLTPKTANVYHEGRSREAPLGTKAIGSWPANGFGLHEMHGNVEEWCWDAWDKNFPAKPEASKRNPCSTRNGGARVVRGGSFVRGVDGCQSWVRNRAVPYRESYEIGFRPAIEARFVQNDLPQMAKLERLKARAIKIFDASHLPETKVAAMEAWLAEAEELEDWWRRSGLADGMARSLAGAPFEVERQKGILAYLRAELDRFLDVKDGLKIRMELLVELTRDEERLWTYALESIQRLPRYAGLELRPQFGLTPLRLENETGLWTFVHFFGFDIPPRNEAGRLDVTQLRQMKCSDFWFVLVPRGSFGMGAPEGEIGSTERERPAHRVHLDPFFIGKVEVTVGQWQRVMGYYPSSPMRAGKPAEGVTWRDAQLFCSRVGLSLPTEAQWEYACRAGTSTAFSFGDTIRPNQALYDYRKPYNGSPQASGSSASIVACFPPNPWGLYDMHGNVREWCSDFWDERFYRLPEATDRNPTCRIGTQPMARVLRGGGWYSPAVQCRSAWRRSGLEIMGNDAGLRLARTIGW